MRAMTTEERRSLLLHEAIAAQLLENPRAVLRLARRNLALMRREHPWARIVARAELVERLEQVSGLDERVRALVRARIA